MRQSSSSSNHHVWLFRANFYSRQCLFPIFGTPIKQKLTSRGSRTPIYEKHHLVARRRISWADLSRTPIYEIWSDSNLGRKSNCGLILGLPVLWNLSNFNSNFQFQFHSSNFILPIFQPPFFQPNHHSLTPRTWFISKDGLTLGANNVVIIII